MAMNSSTNGWGRASIDAVLSGTIKALFVSPERLQRFFTEVNGNYRIAKSIRDACIFSRHNVLADPPFSRIDMISCRNLLIYLDNFLQKKAIATFHYALNPTGFLLLGKSETIGSSASFRRPT